MKSYAQYMGVVIQQPVSSKGDDPLLFNVAFFRYV
jgi:hypothetical protein